MNSFELRSLTSRFLLIWVLIGMSMVSACKGQQKPAESETGTGAVVGANYTEHAIQGFSIDGAAGSNISPYSGGGGHVCCATYPKRWTSEFTVTVKWRRSDGRDLDGKRWRIKALERVVFVDKYAEEGNLWVLFLPDDEVKVFISIVGVGNPNFPTNPGYPEDAKPSKDKP